MPDTSELKQPYAMLTLLCPYVFGSSMIWCWKTQCVPAIAYTKGRLQVQRQGSKVCISRNGAATLRCARSEARLIHKSPGARIISLYTQFLKYPLRHFGHGPSRSQEWPPPNVLDGHVSHPSNAHLLRKAKVQHLQIF